MALTTEERIARAPEWVKTHIRSLETHLSYLQKRNSELESQLELASGRQSETETNVRYETEDMSIALPQDSEVTFQGKFGVQPSANDPDGIDVYLNETGALCVIPDQGDHIFIRRLT